MDAAPPPGFRPLDFPDRPDFAGGVLRLHATLRDGVLGTGFRVERRHLNMGGICHGGVLATFLDIHLAYMTALATGSGGAIVPTVSLSIDYLDAARPDEWLEAHGELLRATGRFAFTGTLLRAGEGPDARPIARASAIYKLDRSEAATGGFADALRARLSG